MTEGIYMHEKFLPELARRLGQKGIAVGQEEHFRLPVLVDGEEILKVKSNGTLLVNAGTLNDPKVSRIYDTVAELNCEVYEYTSAMVTCPQLQAEGLREGFRLLAEFNGVVLAGREMERGFGYQFVTWRRSADHTGVNDGNYYDNDYAGAKLNFATRSGLVQKSRQFTDEQLTELYRCVHETLDSEYLMTKERENMLMGVVQQIESSVDDLEERVNLSNQRELEIMDHQAGDIPGLSF